MTRMDQLLTALVEFNDGRSLDGDFLREHNVTSDECFEIEEHLTMALTHWVSLTSRERGLAVVRNAMFGVGPK